MSRATIVYIVVIAVSAAGLWGILRAGAHLRAPSDLSGTWDIGGEDPATLERLGESVAIEQSGQFFQMTFARGLQVDLKLSDEKRQDSGPKQSFGMLFSGPQWQLTAIGESADGPFIFRLTGPERHTFTVARHDAERKAVAAVTSTTSVAQSNAP